MFPLEELQKAEEKKLIDDTEINVGMTDKEVIMALEWALKTSSWTASVAGEEQNMFRAILDLINRQKYEITQLKSELSAAYDNRVEICKDLADKKAEIERLTAEIDQRREMMERMNCNYATELQKNTELQKQVDELKGGKGLFISQDKIDWVCSLGVMVHIEEDSPVVLLNRYKYENTCADYDRRIFHFEEEKEQAVKERTKEILGDLRNVFIEQSSYGCDANQHIGYYDYEVKMGLVIEQIEEYAKEKYGIEYGVEVE